MAPRKQGKQAASVALADADGDVTSSKKQKTANAVKSTDESKSVKVGLRRAKANKHEEPVEDNDVAEEPPRKTVEKKTRAKPAMAKKAETAVAKPKAKATRKQKNAATESVIEGNVEENAGDGNEKKNSEPGPAKRTRATKAIKKESVAEVTRPIAKAKAVTKKRKNVEDDGVVAEFGDAQVTEKVLHKKTRGKTVKADTDVKPEVKPKGRTKKEVAKVEIPVLSPQTEAEKNNHNLQGDSSKTKESKKTSVQKGNSKKGASKGKRKIIPEETNGSKSEETTKLKADVNENGESENVQTEEPKQKKRNTGKGNTISKKTETKNKQKKGQTIGVPVNEEITKDTTAKNNTTEEADSTAEVLHENNTKDVSSNSDSNVQTENEEEDRTDQSKFSNSSLKSEVLIKNEPSNDEIDTSTDKGEN